MFEKIKHHLVILVLLFGTSMVNLYAQSIYEYSFRDINNHLHNIQDYQGKKIMFIVLTADTTFTSAHELVMFADSFKADVKVIGIVSMAPDFSNLIKEKLRILYSGSSITLTEATIITKGSEQSPLLRWLTNKTENRHFDIDAVPGRRFCVNRNGTLFSITDSSIPLQSAFVKKIITAVHQN